MRTILFDDVPPKRFESFPYKDFKRPFPVDRMHKKQITINPEIIIVIDHIPSHMITSSFTSRFNVVSI